MKKYGIRYFFNLFFNEFGLYNNSFFRIKLIYCSSTSDDSFVKMPVSKFFLCPLFIPIPAHVKFAEPMYAVSMSNISA